MGASDQPATDEPPIREFADRGVLWLLESKENLRSLVRMLAADIADTLDFSQAERDNRSFIPDDLHKQEADLLYRVPLASKDGKGAIWIYVLLEHQSSPDRSMGLRLLIYMVKVWEAQRRAWLDARLPASKWRLYPILPIVFYTGKRRWKTALSVKALMDVPQLLEAFVPEFEALFLPLHTLSAEQLTGSSVGAVLRALQAVEAPQEELASVLREVVAFLESLPEEARPEWRRAMQYLFLLIHHKRPPGEQAQLNRLMVEMMGSDREEVSRMAATSAQVLIATGRKQGREEGKLEGRNEILLDLLSVKFGPLSEGIVAAVGALSDERAHYLARKLLTAATLADLDL